MSRLLGDLAYGNLVQVAEAIETGRLAPPFSGVLCQPPCARRTV